MHVCQVSCDLYMYCANNSSLLVAIAGRQPTVVCSFTDTDNNDECNQEFITLRSLLFAGTNFSGFHDSLI